MRRRTTLRHRKKKKQSENRSKPTLCNSLLVSLFCISPSIPVNAPVVLLLSSFLFRSVRRGHDRERSDTFMDNLNGDDLREMVGSFFQCGMRVTQMWVGGGDEPVAPTVSHSPKCVGRGRASTNNGPRSKLANSSTLQLLTTTKKSRSHITIQLICKKKRPPPLFNQ